MKLRMNSYSIENWRETSKHFLQQAKTPISLRQKHVISMCDDIFLSEEHTVLVGGGGCEAEGSLAELFVPWHVFIRATRQAADSGAGLRRAGVPGGFHAARKLWSVLWSIPITMSCSLSPPTCIIRPQSLCDFRLPFLSADSQLHSSCASSLFLW